MEEGEKQHDWTMATTRMANRKAQAPSFLDRQSGYRRSGRYQDLPTYTCGRDKSEGKRIFKILAADFLEGSHIQQPDAGLLLCAPRLGQNHISGIDHGGAFQPHHHPQWEKRLSAGSAAAAREILACWGTRGKLSREKTIVLCDRDPSLKAHQPLQR